MVVSERGGGVEHLDPLADRRRSAEVEGRAGDFGQLAGGDQRVVGRRVVIRVEEELVFEDRPGALAAEVEVAVVGHVHQRRLVGGGEVIDAELVHLGQHVLDGDLESSGIALFTVGADVGEPYAGAVGCVERLTVPERLVESLEATVQVVGLIVDVQLVVDPVQREASVRDAVGAATGDAAEVLVVGRLVAGDAIEPQHDVFHLSVPVGHPQLGHGRAEVGDLHHHPASVDDGEQLHRIARGGRSPGLDLDVHRLKDLHIGSSAAATGEDRQTRAGEGQGDE